MDSEELRNAGLSILGDLRKKYPDDIPPADILRAESKAWFLVKILNLSECVISLQGESQFGRMQEIRDKIACAQEDIPQSEFSAICSYIFGKTAEIQQFFEQCAKL